MSIYCRICRVQIYAEAIPLTNSSIRYAKPIHEMIFECTQIMLTKDTRLPQFLCESCLIRLDEAFAFLQLCRESEQIFIKSLPAEPSIKSPTGNGMVHTETTSCGKVPPSDNSIKLELEPEEITVPVEYAGPAFSAYGVLLGASSSDSKEDKDWMVEARKHRERQRVSTAKRRASMTPDQREKERERARLRQAQRRANRSDDEIRAQRERDRIRQAMKRAKFREVEMMQQQPFALEPGINHFN